jgi:Ran GTPase-activating protein (RanGAP) involved in mRNA processing and transport
VLLVLIDITSVSKVSWAGNCGGFSLPNLLERYIPTLGNLVVAKLENLGLASVHGSRVLNQLFVMVSFPVHSSPVMQLAEWLLFFDLCPCDFDTADIVS